VEIGLGSSHIFKYVLNNPVYAGERRRLMKQINMLSAQDIKELSDSVGGVYTLSVLSEVRPTTIYRLINEDYQPSMDSLLKLNIVLEKLETQDENLVSS
tara:strand:- start:116 stop:412 length:297 start_codon:yes stop_codon:yes gene_type:complete